MGGLKYNIRYTSRLALLSAFSSLALASLFHELSGLLVPREDHFSLNRVLWNSEPGAV